MALPTPLQAFSGVPKNTASADKQTIIDGEKMTGAQALIRALEDLGVQDVFGLPGGAILPVFHAINDDTKFRFTLVRHEQAAGHAAEGYAVATGRVGVCIVTSGPGATNMITPIADANMDSVPLVVITGQVGVNAIGTDAFQEADIVGATYPVVKHSYLVTRAQDIPRVLAEAHYIARSGRPGPVVVDLTKTAQTGEMYYSWPQRMILPGYNPTTKAHGRVISDAAKLFAQSYRPVLYVGGGAVRSNASAEVAELAEVTGAPIVTTLPARGIVPNSNPKALGMLGMHGTVAATAAAQRCDLLVAIGASVGSQRDFKGRKPVWLIAGDGSFQMTSEELTTAFLDHAPVKIAIINNSVYGMVRQWQTLFFEQHYSQTNLADGDSKESGEFFDVPDFVKLAEAYGCVGLRAFTEDEAIDAINKANEINDRPVLIDFRVWKDAMVWPMVAAGASNNEVAYRPGTQPLLHKGVDDGDQA